MNEDFLWVAKIFFVLFCLWYIWGGPTHLKQEIAKVKKEPVSTNRVQNTATVYQPAVHYQTIIVR